MLRPINAEPLEKFIQRDIQKLLLLLGAKVYVLGTRRAQGDHQGTRQSPGLPDLIAFLPARLPSRRSRILLIEVKRPGNDLSQAQFDFQTLCQRADIAYVTGNLDRVLTWLTAEGYLHATQTQTRFQLAPRDMGGSDCRAE
jgi:VRR-NUC domain